MKKFSTKILDEAIKKEDGECENIRIQRLQRLGKILERLACEVTFKEAYIFGSITRPRQYKINSDVDIAFSGLDDKFFFKTSAFISRALGIDNVDIVQIEGHRLAKKIISEGIRWTKGN